uniref:Mei2-like C-terminal RNA recognition motif domain-containing protein n=1 Tax=Alexandrium monilatum TaxID=311494 RepID=A0A7S4UI43_9DINO
MSCAGTASSAGPGAITTLMIAGIPRHYSLQDLVCMINSMGYAGRYNFISLVMRDRSARRDCQNIGYGFVNFRDPECASAFTAAIMSHSPEALRAEPAKAQGFLACADMLLASIHRGRSRPCFLCSV